MELNKTYHGDCLELMPLIADKSIDMILCDLPYGTTACKWDVIIPFNLLWEQYKRIIKDNGAIVLTASQPFTSALVMSNVDMFKYALVWDKVNAGNFLVAKLMPMISHEDILIFSHGNTANCSKYNMVYYPQIEKRKTTIKYQKGKDSELYARKNTVSKPYSSDIKYPKSIITIDKENGLHPTQKPVDLFGYLILTYTNENDTVLDNCAGSGTTAIACIKTNRNYICMEKERKYFDIINKRVKEYQQQQSLF